MKISSALLVLFSFVVASSAASIPDIKKDISLVAAEVKELDSSISALPDVAGGATAAQVAIIAKSAQKAISAFQQSTKDIKDTPILSDAQGKAVFALVKPYAPTVIHAFDTIIKKKPSFKPEQAALVGPVLKEIDQAQKDFGVALIAITPASIVAEAKQIQKAVNDAANRASVAYP